MTGFADRWRAAAPPSLAEIEALAQEAYARLPDEFRAMCQDLIIRVEDFPTDEVVESMQVESEFDLLGLFQGGRPAVPVGDGADPYAEHDLALPPADPRLLGRAR